MSFDFDMVEQQMQVELDRLERIIGNPTESDAARYAAQLKTNGIRMTLDVMQQQNISILSEGKSIKHKTFKVNCYSSNLLHGIANALNRNINVGVHAGQLYSTFMFIKSSYSNPHVEVMITINKRDGKWPKEEWLVTAIEHAVKSVQYAKA